MTPDLDVHLPAIAAGDATAFGTWMAAAEPALRRALRAVAARVDVEAVLQEALLRMWQVAPRFVPDGAPNAFLRLAHVTARNLATSELRRARIDPWEHDALARALDAGACSPVAPDPILRRAIVECHDRLPPRPKAALDARLAAAGGRPDRALAAQVEMSPNTFLQNVTRARRLLAECLAARGIDLAGILA